MSALTKTGPDALGSASPSPQVSRRRETKLIIAFQVGIARPEMPEPTTPWPDRKKMFRRSPHGPHRRVVSASADRAIRCRFVAIRRQQPASDTAQFDTPFHIAEEREAETPQRPMRSSLTGQIKDQICETGHRSQQGDDDSDSLILAGQIGKSSGAGDDDSEHQPSMYAVVKPLSILVIPSIADEFELKLFALGQFLTSRGGRGPIGESLVSVPGAGGRGSGRGLGSGGLGSLAVCHSSSPIRQLLGPSAVSRGLRKPARSRGSAHQYVAQRNPREASVARSSSNALEAWLEKQSCASK